jgi:HEPN domain-containing protein
MSPSPAAEVRLWLIKAHNDLAAGTVDHETSPPLVEDSVFHAQQAAEKAMKGFLTWHGRPFRKIHDLREIGGAVIEIDSTLEPLLKRAVALSPFAGVFRYPTEMGEPTLEEAKAALALAREVYEAITQLLPNEVRPT